jgi:hypothetical protein
LCLNTLFAHLKWALITIIFFFINLCRKAFWIHSISTTYKLRILILYFLKGMSMFINTYWIKHFHFFPVKRIQFWELFLKRLLNKFQRIEYFNNVISIYIFSYNIKLATCTLICKPIAIYLMFICRIYSKKCHFIIIINKRSFNIVIIDCSFYCKIAFNTEALAIY